MRSGDGGAEETAYGLQCVDQWLYSPNGTAYVADLVYFQWGLHDGPQLFTNPPANVTIPGQEGNMSVRHVHCRLTQQQLLLVVR